MSPAPRPVPRHPRAICVIPLPPDPAFPSNVTGLGSQASEDYIQDGSIFTQRDREEKRGGLGAVQRTKAVAWPSRADAGGNDPRCSAVKHAHAMCQRSEGTQGMADTTKARAVGFNHVALEVGDIDEALAFYGRLLDFELRGKSDSMAFIDLGDQFLALSKGRRQAPDDDRHLGLVVDDKEAVRQAMAAHGIESLSGPFLDFLDSWGNRIEIVGYENIQFTKAPHVLRGMKLDALQKSPEAIKELTDKGMAPG